jgi:hypothetical protein
MSITRKHLHKPVLAAVLLALFTSGVAEAKIATNRIAMNRIAMNRIAMNRIAMNRIATNGVVNAQTQRANPFAGLDRRPISR